jgi:PAS domain-containing protein
MDRESNDQLSPELREQYERENRRVIEKGELVRAESTLPTEAGETYWLTYKFPVDLHGQTLLGAVSIDITEQKRAEKRFETIFVNSPVSLWEEDFSRVRQQLASCGITTARDAEEYLEANSGQIRHLASLIRVIDVNQATLRLFEASDKTMLLGSLDPLITEDTLGVFRREIPALWASGSYSGEGAVVTTTGREIPCLIDVSVAPGCEESWARVFVSILDIHELKHAQEALANTEKLLPRK